MAFATETFSDVNPFVRFRIRSNATRGVIAGGALVGVGTVALAWMVATVVTMQTMGMSLGSGSAISSHAPLGATAIALIDSYEKQKYSEAFSSFSLKGGRVWKKSIADIGRFAAAPLDSAAVERTALSAATLVEHFKHVVSTHGSGALAKTDRIARADPTAEQREEQANLRPARSAQQFHGIPGPLVAGQFEITPRAVDKKQTDLALANPTASTDESRDIVTPDAAPAHRLSAIADGLPALGKVAALDPRNPASLSVASIALPVSNPSAPPMHFMPMDAVGAPSMPPAHPTEGELATPAPVDIQPENTATAIAIPVPTPAPLERSPASTDTANQETELASVESDMEDDLPDDVPLPMTRPRGLPKIITEGPAGQTKPSAGQALAYARPDNPLRDDEDEPGPRPLFGPRSRGGVAIYDISAHMVYLPSGERLEAHSGLGGMLDNPRYVKQKNRGPTPPHTYDLVMREKLFHGVAAIRLLPVDASKIYGRDGLLAHTYMLGPRGDSNGCVSFRDYRRFLAAFKRGEIKQLVVVPRLSSPPTRFAFAGRAT